MNRAFKASIVLKLRSVIFVGTNLALSMIFVGLECRWKAQSTNTNNKYGFKKANLILIVQIILIVNHNKTPKYPIFLIASIHIQTDYIDNHHIVNLHAVK